MAKVELDNNYIKGRAIFLDKVDRDFRTIDKILGRERHPKAGAFLPYRDVKDKSRELWVNRQFHFGMYLIRRSLVKDLEDAGKREVVEAVFETNSRLAVPVPRRR